MSAATDTPLLLRQARQPSFFVHRQAHADRRCEMFHGFRSPLRGARRQRSSPASFNRRAAHWPAPGCRSRRVEPYRIRPQRRSGRRLCASMRRARPSDRCRDKFAAMPSRCRLPARRAESRSARGISARTRPRRGSTASRSSTRSRGGFAPNLRDLKILTWRGRGTIREAHLGFDREHLPARVANVPPKLRERIVGVIRIGQVDIRARLILRHRQKRSDRPARFFRLGACRASPANDPVSLACCSGRDARPRPRRVRQPPHMQHARRGHRAPARRGRPHLLAAIPPARDPRPAGHVPRTHPIKRMSPDTGSAPMMIDALPRPDQTPTPPPRASPRSGRA